MALIVPVAAPAILSFSMRVLCVFIDLLRSPSLCRDAKVRRQGATSLRRDGVYFLSLFLYVCLCVYVFMQFMGQGATFTDYVQIRICEIAARASPAEQCVQCVALGMMKPNRRRNRDQTTHTALNSKLKQLN